MKNAWRIAHGRGIGTSVDSPKTVSETPRTNHWPVRGPPDHLRDGGRLSRAIHSGFRIGADDYIINPFDPEGLSWRVRAVLRRSGHVVAQVWESNDLVVDEGTRLVTRAGTAVALTATEFTLLAVLVRNRTRVVPKRQLLGQVWGYDADDHLVEVHTSALRRKLEAHGPRIIQTVRGAGYVLRS